MKYLVIIAYFASILLSCNEKDAPIKPDPCDGKTPVTADFKVYEVVQYRLGTQDYTHKYETYEVTTGRQIIFEAEGNYASYQWQLGDDPRIHYGKTKSYEFHDDYKDLTMRLIVYNPPNKDCFPDDNGWDTLYKAINVYWREQVPILGKYVGCNEHEPDKIFEVEIKIVESEIGVGNYSIAVTNINYGCFFPYERVASRNRLGARVVLFSVGTELEFGCNQPRGIAKLQDDLKTIRIEYTTGPYDDGQDYVFIGERVE